MKESIAFACIYRPDGSLFARYRRDDYTGQIPSVGLQEEGHWFVDGWLGVRKKIYLGDEFIGSIRGSSGINAEWNRQDAKAPKGPQSIA